MKARTTGDIAADQARADSARITVRADALRLAYEMGKRAGRNEGLQVAVAIVHGDILESSGEMREHLECVEGAIDDEKEMLP